MEDIAPVLICGIIFYFTAYIVRLSIENRTRQKLIDKGLSPEQAKTLNFASFAPQAPSSLKWGIVSTALGLGLFVRIMLNNLIDIELRDEFTLGLMLTLAGISLIVYYFIAKKLSDEDRNS